MRQVPRLAFLLAVLSAAAWFPSGGASAVAQIAQSASDPTGVSIPYPLIHLVHSPDPRHEGATANLRAHDPFLLYQLGRDLVQRQLTLAEGAYGRTGELSVPLYVGAMAQEVREPAQARFARDHASSCGTCHSVPYREPGAGQTIASTGGHGRNTTHFYGAGLVEMLGEQIRQSILLRYDKSRNGLIERAEISLPSPALLVPVPGEPPVDFGELSPGPDGVPRLNSAFRIWYVDVSGKALPHAASLNDAQAVAFGFTFQPFGWGRGWHTLADGRRVAQGGEGSTLREVFALAADVHMGLQAFDLSQLHPEGLGPASVSLNGAQQYDFGNSPDRGNRRAGAQISLDDPDGDGKVSELTQGDLDAIEFYLLHAPAPAVKTSQRGERGRKVLLRIGCTRCHREDWVIDAADPERGFAGDRRLFDFAVHAKTGKGGESELTGALVPLSRKLPTGDLAPVGGAFRVRRIYTDFKHWDIGPGFHERRFDGTLQREHRTAPLWGCGSTAPYGHSGRYSSLHEAIRAHGGGAAPERSAYDRLPRSAQRLLLEYLESLVLYATDEIAADVDGDGMIAEDFSVNGQTVSRERFDARFLFVRPLRYHQLYQATGYQGWPRVLALPDAVSESYGFSSVYRRDRDLDGFPDALDPRPAAHGVEESP